MRGGPASVFRFAAPVEATERVARELAPTQPASPSSLFSPAAATVVGANGRGALGARSTASLSLIVAS